jgi:anti-sigma regulatory factor (Ser/Thr protein kinase)
MHQTSTEEKNLEFSPHLEHCGMGLQIAQQGFQKVKKYASINP